MEAACDPARWRRRGRARRPEEATGATHDRLWRRRHGMRRQVGEGGRGNGEKGERRREERRHGERRR
ncbi:hypothetical protein U9M48_004869 [Paspalum notatum var. saurae]|uniref:Uncharacterized protein n=1 Tax=Paspalum notatum var. saurae TaxID=547442 RepID=A0AAQ3PW54_PASNO